LAHRETYGADDLITETDFRRHMAMRFSPGEARAEMDKLKKVLARAVKQGEITPASGTQFLFGDLLGVIARSRSRLSSAANSLPRTQRVTPDGIGIAADEACHVVMPAPTSIKEAACQIAYMALEIQGLVASEKSLQAQLQTLSERRGRDRRYGRLGGRPMTREKTPPSSFQKG
jgi:hypothetical protein